jgi:uncharacterized protein (DUF1800 family)
MRNGGGWRRALLAGLGAALLGLTPACGGGGGGGGTGGPGPTVSAPSGLTYGFSSATWRTDEPIGPFVPNVGGGAPDQYSVTPALPAGIVLDPVTGVLQGVCTEQTTTTDYVIEAANTAGESRTTITLETPWAEWKSLAPRTSFSDEDLRHFLLRTHWSVSEDRLAAIQAQGLDAFIDAMLVFPASGTQAFEADARRILLNTTDPVGQEGLFPSEAQLAQWYLQLLMTNPNGFQEVLGFFWHDHFATASDVLEGRTYYMERHVNMLREKGAGNVRDLLEAVARDWAMLWWLDGRLSTRNAPNENFGREFLELFSVGVDEGYTQADIVELSKVFTGYQDVVLDAATGLRQIVWNQARHDAGVKTPFGETIAAGGGEEEYRTAVDLTVDTLDVAGWMARSLLSYFCYEDPDPVLVEAAAQRLRDANHEIAPLLESIFVSEAFYSARARAAFVKGPVEFSVGFMHATNLPILRFDAPLSAYVVNTRQVQLALIRMGQEPTRPPTVNGWPTGTLWLSSQGMIERANLVRDAISDRTDQTNAGIDVADLLPPGTPTSAEVVDALAARLMVRLSPDERTAFTTYLDTLANSNGTFTPDPFNPANATHLSQRVRGLLYVLAQHPTYMLR